MNVKRVCFVGTRTTNLDATSTLFRDVLGLHNVHTEAGWSIFQLPSGRRDFVEVFGPEHENASLFPVEVREGIPFAVAQPPGRTRSRRVRDQQTAVGAAIDEDSRVGRLRECWRMYPGRG